MQTTLKSSVQFDGVGLHCGEHARMTVHPAPAGYGIRFHRAGVDGSVAARWDNADPTARLCTRLCNEAGVSVSTAEHILAALGGCGVHNARIELDGAEVPILDGSSRPFVEGLLSVGLRTHDAPVQVIEVLKSVEVRNGAATARLEPSDTLCIEFEIDFEDKAIGRQGKTVNLANGGFVRELCDSRTFCSVANVAAMRREGFALGGTLENAIVFDGDRVLNPGGLRHKDEAVRHKMLDALGDLTLAGAPILARYSGNRAGHALTHKLLRELFADPAAFRIVDCDETRAARLPGVGVRESDIPAPV